ncbi:hypothetical protein H4Q26_018200 [Puccinia striiformis f. sp. tritici PST-130]|nr:hypothetical protein H4Q26_018200 [Puccinia striiformis f. sp. tritici PST-130]
MFKNPDGTQPAPSTGIFGSNANPVNTSTYRPLSSTDPTQMNGLEADMGRLTYGSQMNAPPNQHQLSRNPFFTNSYQSSGFQQTLHGPSAHHLPPSNPTMLSHNHQPHPIPNQHPPFSNPNPVPNRNPFLTNNQQSFQPNPDGFTTYYQPSHPQSSTPLSINQHSPFHR